MFNGQWHCRPLNICINNRTFNELAHTHTRIRMNVRKYASSQLNY